VGREFGGIAYTSEWILERDFLEEYMMGNPRLPGVF